MNGFSEVVYILYTQADPSQYSLGFDASTAAQLGPTHTFYST